MQVIDQEEKADAQQTASPSVREKSRIKVQAPSWIKKVKESHLAKEKADDSAMDEIRKAKQMLDEGILTEEEFAQVKVGILKTLGTK